MSRVPPSPLLIRASPAHALPSAYQSITLPSAYQSITCPHLALCSSEHHLPTPCPCLRILLAIVETLLTLGQETGELGPACIIGSASYNLFAIIAVCTLSIKPGARRGRGTGATD